MRCTLINQKQCSGSLSALFGKLNYQQKLHTISWLSIDLIVDQIIDCSGLLGRYIQMKGSILLIPRDLFRNVTKPKNKSCCFYNSFLTID